MALYKFRIIVVIIIIIIIIMNIMMMMMIIIIIVKVDTAVVGYDEVTRNSDRKRLK